MLVRDVPSRHHQRHQVHVGRLFTKRAKGKQTSDQALVDEWRHKLAESHGSEHTHVFSVVLPDFDSSLGVPFSRGDSLNEMESPERERLMEVSGTCKPSAEVVDATALLSEDFF